MNIPHIEHAVKFTEVNECETKRKSFMGSRNLLMVEARKEHHHQEVEIAVKRLFVDTGLNSIENFVEYFYHIENINQKLYGEVNSDTDKISELQREVRELK